MSRTTLTALALLALSATAVSAEELNTPAATSSSQPPTVTVPARGTTKSKVEAQFGTPQDRTTPVGKPPITRWEYPGFTVYFEHDHVVHAVVH